LLVSTLLEELKLDTGEKRAFYRLWEALEEFQSLLLLIQRRNSACKPPGRLRKRCGALEGLSAARSSDRQHCLRINPL